MTTPTSTAARSPPQGLRRRVGLRGATFRPGRGAVNCRRLPPPMSPSPVRAPRDESTQEYAKRRSRAVPIRRSRAVLISVLEGAEPSGRPARKASLEGAGPRATIGRGGAGAPPCARGPSNFFLHTSASHHFNMQKVQFWPLNYCLRPTLTPQLRNRIQITP